MQPSSALYDPIAAATPEQRLRAVEHRLRIQRIAKRAMALQESIPPDPVRIVEITEQPVDDTKIEVVACNGQIVIVTDKQVAAAKAVFERLDSSRPHPSVERIQRSVCKYFEVRRNDLVSQRRTAEIVVPRQVAMYIARKMTMRSLPEIGRLFGNRDHTTVLHAVRKISALIERDEGIKNSIQQIEAHLSEAFDVVD